MAKMAEALKKDLEALRAHLAETDKRVAQCATAEGLRALCDYVQAVEERLGKQSPTEKGLCARVERLERGCGCPKHNQTRVDYLERHCDWLQRQLTYAQQDLRRAREER